MHLIKISLLFILSAFSILSIGAEVSSKGMGTAFFSGWKAKAEDKRLALDNAKFNSIERYLSKGSSAQLKNFDLIKGSIKEDIDSYVLDYTVVSEKIDKEDKRIVVVIRSTINAVRINNELQNNSAVSNASDWEKSYLAFVFVAREQKLVKSYDKKVFKREDASVAETGSEYESHSSGVEYASENQRSSITTTGGSTTQKADVVEYDVSSASEINSVMNKVFSNNGFEVVEAEYLYDESEGLLNPSEFIEDYRHGDDISGKTRRNAAKGARMLEIPYLALGTLDVGMKDIDPTTGLTRVSVTVSGKVIDVKGRFPKTVGSVGPIQYSGIGQNQSVARVSALKTASEEAAKQLANQLNAKGIK